MTLIPLKAAIGAVELPLLSYDTDTGRVQHPLPTGGTGHDFTGPVFVDGQPLLGYPPVPGEPTVVNSLYPFGDIRRYGGDPTGVADSRAALLAADSTGSPRISRGTYLLSADTRTVNRPTLDTAAWLAPASGVTLTIAGGRNISLHQWWFDASLGGKLLYESMKGIDTMSPCEVGAFVWSTPVDEYARLQLFINALPDWAQVDWPKYAYGYLSDQLVFSDRESLVVDSGINPRDAWTGTHNAPVLVWIGAAGKFMIKWDRMRSCVLAGLSLYGQRFAGENAAAGGIDADGYSAGHIGTQCAFRRNVISPYSAINAGVTAWAAIRISHSVTDNHEYYEISDNTLFGLGATAQLQAYGGAIAAGSAVLTNDVAVFTSAMQGRRVRVGGAGVFRAAGTSTGTTWGRLDTTILTVDSPTQVTLAATAANAVTGAYVMVGELLGFGIEIGPSSNAKSQRIFRNNFTGCGAAIRAYNGSFRSDDNSYTFNEVNIWADALSEPLIETCANSEFARQHMLLGSGVRTPVCTQFGRFDTSWCPPSTGFFETQGNQMTLDVERCGFEDGLSQTARLHDSDTGVWHTGYKNRYAAGNYIYTQLGYSQLGESVREQGLGDGSAGAQEIKPATEVQYKSVDTATLKLGGVVFAPNPFDYNPAWGPAGPLESYELTNRYTFNGGPAIEAGALVLKPGGYFDLVANGDTFIERTVAGVPYANLSGWTSGRKAMQLVTTEGNKITAIVDYRNADLNP